MVGLVAKEVKEEMVELEVLMEVEEGVDGMEVVGEQGCHTRSSLAR